MQIVRCNSTTETGITVRLMMTSIRVETGSVNKNKCWYDSVYFVLSTEYYSVDCILLHTFCVPSSSYLLLDFVKERCGLALVIYCTDISPHFFQIPEFLQLNSAEE
jgi:hypothetical protein